MSSPEPEQAEFEHLVAIAGEALPGADLATARTAQGQDHDVVLLPGVAAVRVARHEQAARLLPRRTTLLARLAALDLPFAVPEPLAEVTTVAGRTVAVTSWVPGEPRPVGSGDPERLGALLEALRAVPVDGLADVLDVPHAYAGRERWHELMVDEVVPRLPGDLRAEARRRTDAAAALEPVPPALVHGDLAGHNVHWDADGRLVGVLDWDLASPFDPAVDAACLGWFGWPQVRAAVGAAAYDRARTWYLTFGLEQVVASLLNGDDPVTTQTYVDAAVRWVRRTRAEDAPASG